jgi:hypothetical protein
MHRRSRAVYVDKELHVLCVELVLHLLSSPSGQLDPLQLPQNTTGEYSRQTCCKMVIKSSRKA